MALYELREYKVREGKMPAWLTMMEGEVIPYLVSKGIVINASFCVADDETKYVWIRRFEDEADRAR